MTSRWLKIVLALSILSQPAYAQSIEEAQTPDDVVEGLIRINADELNALEQISAFALDENGVPANLRIGSKEQAEAQELAKLLSDNVLFSERIRKFILLASNSLYAMVLTEEQFNNALASAGFDGVRERVATQARLVRGESFRSTQVEGVFKTQEALVKMIAAEIAQDMYKSHSTAELNLKFFTLGKFYLHNPRSRGAIGEIIEAFASIIDNSFFTKLEQMSSPLNVGLVTQIVTATGVGVALATRPRVAGKSFVTDARNATTRKGGEILKSLTRFLPESWRPATKSKSIVEVIKESDQAQSAVQATRQMTREEAMDLARANGAYIPRAKVSKTELIPVGPWWKTSLLAYRTKSLYRGITKTLTKDTFLRWLKSTSTRETFKNFLFIQGATGAVGAAAAGTWALYDRFVDDSLRTRAINLKELFNRDYLGLSTLLFQCQVRTMKANLENSPDKEKFWNKETSQMALELMADYELLHRVSEGYHQKRFAYVPAQFSTNNGGEYHAEISHLGKKVPEIIPCPKLEPEKDDALPVEAMRPGYVQVSLEGAVKEFVQTLNEHPFKFVAQPQTDSSAESDLSADALKARFSEIQIEVGPPPQIETDIVE